MNLDSAEEQIASDQACQAYAYDFPRTRIKPKLTQTRRPFTSMQQKMSLQPRQRYQMQGRKQSKTRSVKVLKNLNKSSDQGQIRQKKSEVTLLLAQREPFLENFTNINYVLMEDNNQGMKNDQGQESDNKIFIKDERPQSRLQSSSGLNLRQDHQSTSELRKSAGRATFSSKTLMRPEPSNRVLDSDYSLEQLQVNREGLATSHADRTAVASSESLTQDGAFKVSKKP